MIHFFLLMSRQGKVRLAKWYSTYSQKDRARAVKEITPTILARPLKLCNFLEWRNIKLVYKRYASLYFVCGIDATDNELLTLEIMHSFVEARTAYLLCHYVLFLSCLATSCAILSLLLIVYAALCVGYLPTCSQQLHCLQSRQYAIVHVTCQIRVVMQTSRRLVSVRYVLRLLHLLFVFGSRIRRVADISVACIFQSHRRRCWTSTLATCASWT